VYRPTRLAGEAYLKLTVMDDLPIVSFKEPYDTSVRSKRSLMARAQDIPAAGDSALAGIKTKVRQFDESDFTDVKDALANGPEERSVIRLATTCENVVGRSPKL
jgi:hypothetical protein